MDPSPIRAANFCPRGLRVTTFGKQLQKTKGHPDVPPVVKGFFTPKKIAKRFFLASTVRPFGADHCSPQRFVYAKKNREAIFFGVDRAAELAHAAELAGIANAELTGKSKRRAGWHIKRRRRRKNLRKLDFRVSFLKGLFLKALKEV